MIQCIASRDQGSRRPTQHNSQKKGIYSNLLKTMKDDILSKTNFLIDQKVFDIGPLISAQLNNFSYFQVFLHGSVATEILFESLTYSLHIQVVSETGNRCDTLSSVSLLDTNMDLLFRGHALVSGVLKGVCVTTTLLVPVIDQRR